MDFPGVALVTGAASGIGKATALRYAEEGCQRIVIADVNLQLLEATKKCIKCASPSTEVKAVAVDVRSQASVKSMVDAAISTFGRLDYCVNSAGIIRFGDTAILPVVDFDMVLQVNLRGVFLCAKEEIKAMLQQEPLTSKDSPFPVRGSIVNVASAAGLSANGDLPSYVASKHGVIGLSKSDGLKFGKNLIRVNALCPGTVETPILGDLPQGDAGAERAAQRNKEIALGRVGQPREIAECALWLTSGKASFVTAATLAPHGGLRL